MRISDTTLPAQELAQLEANVARVLKELQTLPQVQAFWHDFFTPTERIVLAKRLAIAVLLSKGQSYGTISQKLAVSSATISFVAEQLQKKGFKLALRKITDDEWAEKVLERLGW